MLPALLAISFLGLLFGLLFRRQGHDFSARTARTRVRSISGPNLLRWLGVLGLAVLLLEAAALPIVAVLPGGETAIVVIVVALVVATGAGLHVSEVIVGVASLAVFVFTLGVGEAVSFVVALLLLSWLFVVARGFLG